MYFLIRGKNCGYQTKTLDVTKKSNVEVGRRRCENI